MASIPFLPPGLLPILPPGPLPTGKPKPKSKIIPLTPHQPDTPEWLRFFPGCQHYTDEEATEIISALNVLTPILLQSANRILQPVDNHLVSYLQGEKETPKLKIAA